MQLDEHRSGTGFTINRYQNRTIEISGSVYTESLLLTPTEIITLNCGSQLADICFGLLKPALDAKPDILLLGTGPRMLRPEAQLLTELNKQVGGVEFMATLAACRTYNLLVSEGRRVSALLLIDSIEQQ